VTSSQAAPPKKFLRAASRRSAGDSRGRSGSGAEDGCALLAELAESGPADGTADSRCYSAFDRVAMSRIVPAFDARPAQRAPSCGMGKRSDPTVKWRTVDSPPTAMKPPRPQNLDFALPTPRRTFGPRCSRALNHADPVLGVGAAGTTFTRMERREPAGFLKRRIRRQLCEAPISSVISLACYHGTISLRVISSSAI